MHSKHDTFMAGWVERAVRFARGMMERATRGTERNFRAVAAPPFSAEEFRRWQDQIDSPIPVAIEQFLRTGSARCDCHFWTQFEERILLDDGGHMLRTDSLYGGARLCHAEASPEWLDACQGASEIFEELEDAGPRHAAIWRRSFPFAKIGNGDFLALDLAAADDAENPPVVYLGHEFCSDEEPLRPIAPNFEAFLRNWEQVCYIGPQIWMLGPFIHPEPGFLDPTCGDLPGLREKLGLVE